MINIVILSVLFRAAISTCPAMQHAYEQGIRKSAIIGQTDDNLIRNGAIVNDGDIGNFFFAQPPYPSDANDDFNRTLTLIYAEQILGAGILDAKKLLNTLNEHTNCLTLDQRCSTMPIEKCPKDLRYRTITGACNNIKNPKWGKSITPYGRFQPANFFDGIHEIRKSFSKKIDLPGARNVANDALNKSPYKCKNKLHGNHVAVMYGQLIAHDHGMRQMIQTQEGGFTRSCCTRDYSRPLARQPFGCHAFEYKKDDPYLSQASPNCNIRCQNYIRSQVTFPNDCNLAAAQAVNFVTHYLDLSTVYGSEESVINALRSFKNGKLKNNENEVLPETCDDKSMDCYLTGDIRGTAFFTLGVLQSIYHRMHNIIAIGLKKVNPKWNDERLFQEAKRINVAIFQNNVYTEWLRVFVGDQETKHFRPSRNEYLGSYNPNVNASSTVEFSQCALRVYHANLNDKFNLIDTNNRIIRSMDIDECDEGLKILETNYSDVIRGMVHTSASHSTFSHKIRNQLFNNGNKFNLGFDLISTDIFVGRDVGIRPFYIYFELCTKKKIRSWDDLKATIPAESVEDLKKVYGSPYDVDLYAALALEEKCDSYLGTVGKCLMVMQYDRTRSGDRYFYSFRNGAYPFTPAQLEVIYKFKYANVLCTATDIDEVPSSAFETPSHANPMIKCSRGINLNAWKDTKA